MGTSSTTKFLYNNAGTLTEKAAIKTSAGAGDANAVPALNTDGVLDHSIVNAKTASAGAGDSGVVVALDATGKIDVTMMPPGVSADVTLITASEALAAGDYVNVWNNPDRRVRKADATAAGKDAHGFVLAAVNNGATATVYSDGMNTSVTGQTPGVVYLSTSAGLGTSVAPSGSGNVVQRIGVAMSDTSVSFHYQSPVALA